MPLIFDNTYARLPDSFFARVEPTPVAKPELLAVNARLAEELGTSAEEIGSPEYVEALGGNRVLPGSSPIALAYAGHQFGHFVPSLGDGRAILLGEVLSRAGQRFDVQLKGSGRTPFSRGGDGRATLGSVLREYIVSEAMAALGVPTTRSLAVVTTGEIVPRERPFPGAILPRVASSHLRVGTFEYFAYRREQEALARLAEYAFARHVSPELPPEGLALGLLTHVIERQAELVARWMGFGFVHGVMNTDNCTISGETIDYGPCAFLDGFQPDRTFSSIDHGGRYAYDQQPGIARWNMMRLGIALAPLLDEEPSRLTSLLGERLAHFEERFSIHSGRVWRTKLGWTEEREEDEPLVQRLLELLAQGRVDFTLAFRQLFELASVGEEASPLTNTSEEAGVTARAEGRATNVEGESSPSASSGESRFLELFPEGARGAAKDWLDGWRRRFEDDGGERSASLASMKAANPAFIPRNHLVEGAIEAANEGNIAPFERLVRLVWEPFEPHPEARDLTILPGNEQWSYRTFCGT